MGNCVSHRQGLHAERVSKARGWSARGLVLNKAVAALEAQDGREDALPPGVRDAAYLHTYTRTAKSSQR